MEQKVDI